MAKLHYIAYNFVKPPILSEQLYNHYKQHLVVNKNFEFAPVRSIRDEFASELSNLKKSIIIAVVAGIISVAVEFFAIIAVVAFFFLLFGGFSVLYSIQSFSILVKKEKKYYKDLKALIISSSYYTEFWREAMFIKI